VVTDRITEREIFGPILPIIAVEDVDEMIEFINARYACPLGP
jgi:acyl-CoA reductase-like NAD-dependent aldehyde dehydrogenase